MPVKRPITVQATPVEPDGRPSTPPKIEIPSESPLPDTKEPIPSSGRPSTPRENTTEDTSSFSLYGSTGGSQERLFNSHFEIAEHIKQPCKKRQSEDLWSSPAEHSQPVVDLDREDRGEAAGDRGLDEPGDDFEFEVEHNEPGDDIDGDLIEIR